MNSLELAKKYAGELESLPDGSVTPSNMAGIASYIQALIAIAEQLGNIDGKLHDINSNLLSGQFVINAYTKDNK